MFEKFSKKIGFTKTEILVILFLATLFIVGFVYVEFIKGNGEKENKYFDYSEQDSLFEFYSGNNIVNDDQSSPSELEIKKQVLELPDTIIYKKKDTEPLKEKSIDINNAGIDELVKLPGIGEKTAEKIVAYRTQNGNFKTLEELMEVKGIGNVKFNKIKKFLYIK